MRWMETAWAEIGEKEIAGARNNPRILDFLKAVNAAPEMMRDETAWCAAFVAFCLEDAGIKSTRSLMARSYVGFGRDLKKQPRVGAIGVVPRGKDQRFGHVFFIDGFTETEVIALGGNQGDSVSRVRYPRSQLIYVGWPEVVTPKDLDKVGSRIARAGAKQKQDAGAAAGLGASDAVVPVAPPAELPAPGDLAAQATSFKGVVTQFSDFGLFCWQKWPWIAAALVIYFGARLAWNAARIRWWRAEDESTGKTVSRVSPETIQAEAEEMQGEPARFATEAADAG